MKLYALLQISYNPSDKCNTFSSKVLHLSTNYDIIQTKFTEAMETISKLYKVQECTPHTERVNNMVLAKHDPANYLSIFYNSDKNTNILTTTAIETDELPKKEPTSPLQIGDIITLNKDAFSDFQKMTGLAYEPEIMFCKNPNRSKEITEVYIATIRLPGNCFAYLGSTYNLPKSIIHKCELK